MLKAKSKTKVVVPSKNRKLFSKSAAAVYGMLDDWYLIISYWHLIYSSGSNSISYKSLPVAMHNGKMTSNIRSTFLI